MFILISEKYQSHILSLSLSGISIFNIGLPVFHHLSKDESHRLLVAGMMLAPKSKCSVPGSFENGTLLICIRVFWRPILFYLDVCGVEVPLLSTVSISNCKYQEAPGMEILWISILLLGNCARISHTFGRILVYNRTSTNPLSKKLCLSDCGIGGSPKCWVVLCSKHLSFWAVGVLSSEIWNS